MQKPYTRTQAPEFATIESLDQEGRGVAHANGKVIFIEGALPGEKVSYKSTRRKASYEFATVVDVLKASNLRTEPKCPHFHMCGGCAMQHLEFSGQVAAKQRLLENNLWHIGRVKAEQMLSPIYGPAWGYRHKARLRVKYVPAKARVLVGFNEKATHFVTDIKSCQVLPPHVSALIVPLQELLIQLTIRDATPQIELAVGENATVLVFRIMEPLEPKDEPILREFADTHGVQIWTQTKGPDTVKPFHPLNGPGLNYTLPEFNLSYPFKPTEFTQVNPYINRVMIRRAMQLLDPQPDERIADFFCGLGNFTLPIARSGASVFGMEGSAPLVQRAVESAALNGLDDHVIFREADLFDMTPESLASLGYFDKWLIDPPRDGAMELVKSLDADGKGSPRRIVYVSCNPATLSRDAALLIQKGYVLKSCGIINMFPHTSHVESIALFELASQA
ncbi:MAG TPA: 23S rRNA (uracil(1939)-C(5))-methyltransferase RlmD [Methylophilaceae bacterium]|nr:23S rRNA (uracil(1939)-C(5))-methyltransferase RlmD [Methylophilaceae bacterium]